MPLLAQRLRARISSIHRARGVQPQAGKVWKYFRTYGQRRAGRIGNYQMLWFHQAFIEQYARRNVCTAGIGETPNRGQPATCTPKRASSPTFAGDGSSLSHGTSISAMRPEPVTLRWCLPPQAAGAHQGAQLLAKLSVVAPQVLALAHRDLRVKRARFIAHKLLLLRLCKNRLKSRLKR